MKIRYLLTFVVFLVCSLKAQCDGETWTVAVPEAYAPDQAIELCVRDLNEAGIECGLRFVIKTGLSNLPKNSILIGNSETNPATARWLKQNGDTLHPVQHPHGFQIKTYNSDSGKIIIVAGGSVPGDVYGLYWIWDRLKVHKRIPDIDVERSPGLGVRLTSGESMEDIRNALRYGACWVSGRNILNLIPWDSEPERTVNEAYRQETRKLIDYAHSLHLNYLAWCDEMTFHPTLLKEFDAALDPADPRLWDALQKKYRMLFEALPELDGVRIRTGELTRVSGEYIPYDVIHERGNSGWTLEETYRTFVKKLHQVVVGESGKIYFHRTWVTNTTEQHSDPNVYKKIFTDDVPADGLYLSPYLSKADRWFYQPYNPTFNLTPHSMVVLLSTLDYHAHHGVNVFPAFPGDYYQGGLSEILGADRCNVKGSHFSVPTKSDWDTLTVTAYTAFRLSWNPEEDLSGIAKDFAAMYFGEKTAKPMADILLLSAQAYKDGLYIKPVAESVEGNTLPQLRLTSFPVQGFPEIDKGKTHIDWLERTIYQPCVGRMEEATEYLDRGLDTVLQMKALFSETAPSIEDQALALKTGESLELTFQLIQANNLYAKICFAYFDYRKHPTPENRERLSLLLIQTREALAQFAAVPGYVYQVDGIQRLLTAVDEALADLPKAEQKLAQAFTPGASETAIKKLQELNDRVFKTHSDKAVKFLHWEGFIDGKDAVHVHGSDVKVVHIQHDHAQFITQQLYQALPQKPVTVLIDTIESRPLHPFVLEQPSETNDYTAKVYLFDAGVGSGWFKFDLYYLPEPPSAVGLSNP